MYHHNVEQRPNAPGTKIVWAYDKQNRDKRLWHEYAKQPISKMFENRDFNLLLKDFAKTVQRTYNIHYINHISGPIKMTYYTVYTFYDVIRGIG